MSWLTGWNNRIAFEISNASISEDVADFPILVYLSQHSGICSYNMQEVFSDLGTSSKKIAITTSDGTTQCYVEVEQWDFSNKKAYLWVRIPLVSSTSDNKFYLYWDKDQADNSGYVGDPTSTPGKAVWNTEYLAVYHMVTSGTTLYDSTINSRNLTVYGSPTYADTVLGKGLTLNGSSQYATADIPIIGSNIEGNFIIDAFVNPAAAQSTIFCEAPTSNPGYNSSIYSFIPSTFGIEFSVTGTSSANYIRKQNTGSLLTAGTAYHMVTSKYRVAGVDHGKILIDGFERFAYSTVNTEQVVSGTNFGRINIGRYRLFMGGSDLIGGYFNGTIMDVRILSGTKTDSWYRLNDDSYNDRLITWHPEIRRRIIIDHTKVEHNGSHQLLVKLNDESLQKRCDVGLGYKDVFFLDKDGNILDSVPTGLETIFPVISRDNQWQPDGAAPLQKIDYPVITKGVSGNWNVGYIGVPSVIKDGNTYKMWYGGGNTWTIGYATSTNGVDWSEYGQVLSYGGIDSSTLVFSPNVIKDGSTYKMWYTAWNGSNYKIWYATSPDGIVWTKQSIAFNLGGVGGTYDSSGAISPCVMKESATDYKMWYGGYNGSKWTMNYAISTDGITWTKQGLIIDTSAVGYYNWDSAGLYGPSVIKDGDTYLMIYVGTQATSNICVLCSARSKDGITWSKNWNPPTNVILARDTNRTYDSTDIRYACFIKEDDGYKIWYTGNSSTSLWNILFARTSFEKYWYVRVPTVSTTEDTEIFVVYGSPYYTKYSRSHNVFPYQDGFVGVYLMDRQPTTGSPSTSDYSVDSSVTKNHGQFYGMGWADHWVGKRTRGYNIGSGQYLSLGTNSAMRQTSCVGYSFWVCMNGGTFRTGCGGSGGHGYGGIEINSTDIRYWWTSTAPASDRYLSASVAVPNGRWVMISLFVDFTNQIAKVFVDKTKYSMSISSPATNWVPTASYSSGQTDAIGARYVNSWGYSNNAIVADFQILNQYKDDSWIYTKYNNQIDPGSFCRITSEKDDGYKWNNTFTRQTSYKYFPLQCREWDCYSNASYLPNFSFSNWVSSLRMYSGTTSMGCGTIFASFPVAELRGRSLSYLLQKTGYARISSVFRIYDGQYSRSNDADFPNGTVDNQEFILKGNGKLYELAILAGTTGYYDNLVDLDRWVDKSATGYLTIAFVLIDAYISYDAAIHLQRFQLIERDGSVYITADLDGTIIYDNDFSDSTVGSYPLHFVTPDPGSSVRTVLDTITNSNAVELTNAAAGVTIYDQAIYFGYNMCASFNVRYVSGAYIRWGIHFIQDASNEIMVACGYANNYIDIYEVVGGVTTRRTGTSFSYGTTWHSVWITIYGNTIYVRIDDTVVYYSSLSITVFNYISINTWANSVCRMDNIVIRDPISMGRTGTYNDYGLYGSYKDTPDQNYKLIYCDDFSMNQYRLDVYGTTDTNAPLLSQAYHPIDTERRCLLFASGTTLTNGTLRKYFPHTNNCLITYRVRMDTSSSYHYLWYDSIDDHYFVYTTAASSKFRYQISGTDYVFPNRTHTWSLGLWYYVTIRIYPTNKYRVWVDNYYLGEVTLSAAADKMKLWSLNRYSMVRPYPGSTYISDFRVYDLSRSADLSASPIYTLSGEVRQDGSPVVRQVNTYNRSTGELVNRQLSDNGGTGLFEVTTFNPDDEHYIIALDNDTSPDYNALVFDKLKGKV